MSGVTDKKLFSANEIIKLFGFVLLLGSAWARFEHKMDLATEKVVKTIDEHILADKFEKQIMTDKIADMSKRINELEDEISSFNGHREFLRPSEPTIKRERFR